MVTQKDISAACGVSVAAVSRALRDYPDISEETKQRIREMADRMGYGCIRVGRKKKKSGLIGILVTRDADTAFHRAVIQEIRLCLMLRGYDLVMLNPMDNGGENIGRPGYLPRARLLGLDGIILFSSIHEDDLILRQEHKDLRKLVFGEVPVTAVDCCFSSCGCVLPAYENGIRALFDHMYDLGHRRIAFVYGINTGNGRAWKETSHALIAERNLTIPERFICGLDADNPQEAFMKTQELFNGENSSQPTCILFGDYFMLEGGMAALASLGRRIPEDISAAFMCYSTQVGCFMDHVTSWRLYPKQVAKEAVEMLFMEINVPGAAARQTRIVPGVLIKGETTSCLKTAGAPERPAAKTQSRLLAECLFI